MRGLKKMLKLFGKNNNCSPSVTMPFEEEVTHHTVVNRFFFRNRCGMIHEFHFGGRVLCVRGMPAVMQLAQIRLFEQDPILGGGKKPCLGPERTGMASRMDDGRSLLLVA